MGVVNVSLAEENLAASAEVLSGLGGTLVGASLQTNYGLASLHHLIGEITLALIGRLGSKVGAGPFRVSVCLR